MLTIDIHDNRIPFVFHADIPEGRLVEIVCEEEKKGILMEILSGKREFDGDICLDGISQKRERDTYIRQVDVVGEELIQTSLPVQDFIRMHGLLRRCYDAEFAVRMDRLLGEFRLEECQDLPLCTLGGTTQKTVRYIASFLGNTTLLVIENYGKGTKEETRRKIDEWLLWYVGEERYGILLTTKASHKKRISI